MVAMRTVAIDRLRERLQVLLGADSLLFRRFERALASRDPERLGAAMDALALYPGEVRQQVEDALLAWLLGGGNEEPVVPTSGRGRR